MVIENEASKPEEESIQMVAMLNEAPFAPGLSDDYGVLDFNMLLRANFSFVNGTYFRTTLFNDIVMFKENFEILSDYEFMLRMVYDGKEIISIPKVARFHYHRADSEFERQKNLDPEQREYWLNMVKREYMFAEDREFDNK